MRPASRLLRRVRQRMEARALDVAEQALQADAS